MKKIIIINGPNLNLLGKREPEIYGSESFEVYFKSLKEEYPSLDLDYYQSNIEGELVDEIQKARGKHIGIIINPGALTHYGWSIHDALVTFDGVIIEMHLSNPNQRESWRHTSVVAPVAHGSIIGFGIHGYELSVRALHKIIGNNAK